MPFTQPFRPFLLIVLLAADLRGAADIRFFEQKVRPLLVERCYSCHSVAEKTKGGLALDSAAGWQEGGDSGAAIVPGKPEASLLFKAVSYDDKDLQMPPKGKLPDAEVTLLREWIAMGAPDPRTTPPSSQATKTAIESSELWSFQPLKEVAPPEVADSTWSTNPIDRFVRARLEATGLSPAQPASPSILLRRLHLALTGLPPTPDQLNAFLKTAASKRVSDVIDQLLASDSFGDRWARHWLDLTAYADTIGVGRSIPAIEAWRYRDYVIAAFNSDQPFDDFAREQLAGDIKIPSAPGVSEGPDPTAAGIIATGFLAIGPWELVSGDKPQLRMDVVDRQINRVGKAFLGMTLECARCHEHKFDPISQEDYYRLAGIFRSTVTLNGRINGVFSDINKTPLPETPDDLIARAQRARKHADELAAAERGRKEAGRKVDGLKRRIDKTRKQLAEPATGDDPTGLKRELDDLERRLTAASRKANEHRDRANVLRYLRHSATGSLAYALRDTPEPEDAAINIRGNAHQLGPVIPRGFIREIAPTETPSLTRGGSGRAQLAEWITDRRNPLTARVWVNRVWHHLFGAGLVRTVDNFGATGESPSHAGLLDHLAAEFMADGWSTKRLIRRILLTRTWQQAATNHAARDHGAIEKDPENRLLWRAHRKRLDAEVIRDAMLFVSGRLDDGRGGPGLPFEVPGNFNPGSTGSFKDSSRMPDRLKHRRTIYLPQKRKGPFDELDFINAFDLPDNNHETGRRTTTAVPTQALYLANSKFVHECGRALAERFSGMPDQNRVTAIYRHTLSREPTANELSEALAFIAQLSTALAESENNTHDAHIQAWTRFCQSLLMSNEFLFRS